MSAVEVALLLFAAAFLLVVAGTLVLLLSAFRAGRGERRAEGGAVLILGPLPIAFATGERIVKPLVLLAIILTTFAVAVFLLLAWLLPVLIRV
ncbi:MAG: DUF131 domain-containing protein [Thermofilaceae archaeon]